MILEGSQYFLPSLSTASIRIVRAGLAEGLGEGVAANDLFKLKEQRSVAKIVKAMADWVRMTKLLYFEVLGSDSINPFSSGQVLCIRQGVSWVRGAQDLTCQISELQHDGIGDFSDESCCSI